MLTKDQYFVYSREEYHTHMIGRISVVLEDNIYRNNKKHSLWKIKNTYIPLITISNEPIIQLQNIKQMNKPEIYICHTKHQQR